MQSKTNGLTRTAADNRRLAQLRVKWLIEHSTSHQLLWCIDSFVLRNPPLRQAPNRWAPGAGRVSVDGTRLTNQRLTSQTCVPTGRR
jgi:hypothetical protein